MGSNIVSEDQVRRAAIAISDVARQFLRNEIEPNQLLVFAHGKLRDLGVVDRLPPELLDVLNDAADFIYNYEDVVDGDDGQPRANRAMSLNQRIEQVISDVQRQNSR